MKAAALQYPLNYLDKSDITRISNKSHLYNRNKNITNKGKVMENPYTLYLDYIKFISSMLSYYDEYVRQTGLRKSKDEYLNYIILLVNSQFKLNVSIEEIDNILFFAKLDSNDLEYLESIKKLVLMINKEDEENINFKNLSMRLKMESFHTEM